MEGDKFGKKAEILMRYFRENKSQRAISRELRMSRTTVAKYINEFKSKLELLEDLDKDKE